MKPSTLIVMSVGLIVTIIGFSLCFFATQSAEKDFPDKDLFSFEGENFEVNEDGDTVRSEDFSDIVYVTTDEETKAVEQDVRVLAVTLSNVDSVEIIGGQDRSLVYVYNMPAGLYACRIGSGIMTLSNSFEKSLIFDYLTDILDNFDGIRKYFNPSQFEKREQKVIVYINDDDQLNRIDLRFTNCKNVTVKNLTCSLDCKVVLDNSDVSFENCKFKEPEIIWDTNKPVDPSSPESPTPTPSDDAAPSPAEPTDNDATPDDGEEKPDDGPTVINHYLTVNLNMKNGSSFTSKGCSFSGFTAIVNKRPVTEEDVAGSGGTLDDSSIGTTYISTGGSKCTLTLDMTLSGSIYGFNIRNTPDEDKMSDPTLVTVVNGYPQSQIYLDNAGNKDYPQISADAVNCEIQIKN